MEVDKNNNFYLSEDYEYEYSENEFKIVPQKIPSPKKINEKPSNDFLIGFKSKSPKKRSRIERINQKMGRNNLAIDDT